MDVVLCELSVFFLVGAGLVLLLFAALGGESLVSVGGASLA